MPLFPKEMALPVDATAPLPVPLFIAASIITIAADPAGKYVAVMGDDKVVNVFDEFAVPVATDTYPGTTARDVAIKSMLNGPDPHYIMAGSDQIEIVQPNTTIGV